MVSLNVNSTDPPAMDYIFTTTDQYALLSIAYVSMTLNFMLLMVVVIKLTWTALETCNVVSVTSAVSSSQQKISLLWVYSLGCVSFLHVCLLCSKMLFLFIKPIGLGLSLLIAKTCGYVFLFSTISWISICLLCIKRFKLLFAISVDLGLSCFWMILLVYTNLAYAFRFFS